MLFITEPEEVAVTTMAIGDGGKVIDGVPDAGKLLFLGHIDQKPSSPSGD